MVGVLRKARVVGVLRAPSASSAVEAALAAVRGGLRALELTFTTPGVSGALRELQERLSEDVLLGAGTVMSAPEAEAAIEAGARFLVSPHLGEDVLELCRARGIPYIPGVLTPTEIVRARSLGAEVVKVFPAGSSGGIHYLKDLLGPFPDLEILATGGIKPSEVPAYLQVGVLAVGLGSNLFPKTALEAGDWDTVEAATRQALGEAGVACGEEVRAKR
ncbi:MAG TPA: bifunctional 4-hydroxy-2-oxoglutarate aldolase/2-dehydro-3-deoxy-phosphogluconate aldolase [Meiothermus sp.]|nr:bifunctional 4-hydroxy-2-oxoglutarate aldolase/2-dehydro-3-deoxy-phosphogluconate aldolase [Meiothermus sp.]